MRMKNLFKVKKKGYIAASFRLAVALLYTQYGDRLDECFSPEKKPERVVTALKGHKPPQIDQGIPSPYSLL